MPEDVMLSEEGGVLRAGRSRPRAEVKKDLFRIAAARSDVTGALRSADLLLQRVTHMGDPLYYPLWHATVVAYARPFTRNKPFGALPARWSKFEDATLQHTHDSLLHDRDKLVAHSDADIRRVEVIPPNVFFGGVGPTVGFGVSTYAGGYDIDYFEDVRRLCYDLGSRLDDATNQLLTSLYDGMDLPRAMFPLRIDNGM